MTDEIENTEKEVNNNGVAETATPPSQVKEKKPRAPRKPKSKLLKVDVPNQEPETPPVQMFYVATSRTRPLNPAVNAVVYETDTGDRVQFNGSGWDFVDNLS